MGWGARLKVAMTGGLVALGCSSGGPFPRFEAESGRCETECGLAAEVSDRASCARLQRQERAALRAYETNLSWSEGESCSSLAGWRVTVFRAEDRRLQRDYGYEARPNGFSSEQIRKAAGEDFVAHGQTWCWSEWSSTGSLFARQNELIIRDESWVDGVFAHELMHVLTACENPTHEGWEENGLNAAVQAATRDAAGSSEQ